MPSPTPDEKVIYGHSKKDTERIAESVLFTESIARGAGSMRRQRHFQSSGKAKYNGFFKIIDASVDPTTPPYQCTVVWGEDADDTAFCGFCQINGLIEEVTQLTSNSTFTTSGYVYLRWEWSSGLLVPTLEHEETMLTYELDYLKWPLAYVNVDGGLTIKQIWLGGFFQASLWGEC